MDEDKLAEAVREILPAISPFTPPDDATFSALFSAARAATADAVNDLPESHIPLALVYYIAHLQAIKGGKLAVTSERLGEWSASYGTGSTPFFDAYMQYISGAVMDATLRNSRMITHEDACTAGKTPLDTHRSHPW